MRIMPCEGILHKVHLLLVDQNFSVLELIDFAFQLNIRVGVRVVQTFQQELWMFKFYVVLSGFQNCLLFKVQSNFLNLKL